MAGVNTHIKTFVGARSRRPLLGRISRQHAMQENVPLSQHTTLRVGGPARFFVEAKTIRDLSDAVAWAQANGLPICALGEGSNMLVGDKGFPGLVVKVSLKEIEWASLRGGFMEVSSGAGENWDSFVGETVSRGLSGLENLSYIPGSVGAAPVQNIGAYGVEVGEYISWVDAFNTETLVIERLSRKECAFSYRSTIFKTGEGAKLIITRVGFKLPLQAQSRLDYKDVREYFDERGKRNPSPADIREAVTSIRKNKLPDIHSVGTAGSFFKNPLIAPDHYGRLRSVFPLLPGFPQPGGNVKIPIAWVLDHMLHLRGARFGTVGFHERQVLALVHYGRGTARDVKDLEERVARDVKEKTGITLEPEVVFVGKF